MQPISDPQAKALRLKSVRSLSGMSRKQIELNYGISENTLRMWEQPKVKSKGLTTKGAQRMVQAFSNAGVICTIEWLLTGTGQGPMLYQQLQDQVLTPLKKIINTPQVTYNHEEKSIIDEIALFESTYEDTVVIRINDDAMEPFISYGDFVGGYAKPGESLTDLEDKFCIVKLEKDLTLCRKLTKKNNQWYLNSINAHSTLNKPIVYHPKNDYACTVSWIRKLYLT